MLQASFSRIGMYLATRGRCLLQLHVLVFVHAHWGPSPRQIWTLFGLSCGTRGTYASSWKAENFFSSLRTYGCLNTTARRRPPHVTNRLYSFSDILISLISVSHHIKIDHLCILCCILLQCMWRHFARLWDSNWNVLYLLNVLLYTYTMLEAYVWPPWCRSSQPSQWSWRWFLTTWLL